MSHRTTIVLDEDSRQAARELARHYGCSTAEAIRRAVIAHRDRIGGVPPRARERRRAALHRLYELFEGHDPDEEIRRLKVEDEGF